jgi:hypothetical protein
MMQLRRMSTELVPMDEFERQKQTIIGRFPLQIETAPQVAAQVANSRLLNLATDYVQTYRQRLAAVTREQVQAAARSGMRADAALIVVVGDGQVLKAKLDPIATVTMIDIDGNVIAEEDIAAEAAGVPLAIDRARMVARSDSFEVQLQGRAFGFVTTAIARTADGWEYRETQSLGPILSQSTTVRLTDSLAMRTMEQSGRFQGAELSLRVSYANGMASGEGVSPGASGAMQPVKFDNVAAPLDVVDDNAISAVLPLFPWTADARFTMSVFATGKGIVEQREFRVMAEEAVTVPLGTFAAFRVVSTGGEATATYWIESAAPHRLLKFGPSGVPLEMVRVR